MFRTFDHTADVGLRIEAATLPELFADAGRALLSVLVDDPDAFEAREQLELSLTADRADDLLFDYLSELLYRFSAEQFVPVHYDVEVDADVNANVEVNADVEVKAEAHKLKARLKGERFDPQRHAGAAEVKAITYHGLKLEKKDNGYLAEAIVDV